MTKTGMRRLGKGPQGESFCALKRFGMKVPATLLGERNAEGLAVEFATYGRLVNNWTKTCDEQNLYLCRNFHGSVFPEYPVMKPWAVLVIGALRFVRRGVSGCLFASPGSDRCRITLSGWPRGPR